MNLASLKDISTLFPYSKIVSSRFKPKISDIELDIEKGELPKLQVLPFESISAISKILQGDLKSFVESHIESHVCTNLSNLCRDYPYRIKYSVRVDEDGMSIYSECIDVEILMTIVFGDLVKYFDVYEGLRDGIAFKYIYVPRSFLSNKVQNILTSTIGFTKINIEAKHASKVFDSIHRYIDSINEMIFVIPCLDNNTVKFVESIVYDMVRNPIGRVFIVTSSPSIYDAKICGISYREFFTNYIRLLDLSENLDRVYICSSEAASVELIINRSTYLVTYDIKITERSEFTTIKDYSYVDSFTLKYLRDCLCSSHIVKERKHTA